MIREIDAAALPPMTHAVTRNLYRHISLQDDLQKDIIKAFDDGANQCELDAFQVTLWKKINSLNVGSQGRFRLLVALTRPDEVIDWYLAEFMILWAREQGVAEQQIIVAFRVQLKGS